MSVRTRRVLHSFLRGFVAIMLLLITEHYADITKAVSVGDWASLKSIGLACLGGLFAAALRALQGYVPAIPSPEPSENA